MGGYVTMSTQELYTSVPLDEHDPYRHASRKVSSANGILKRVTGLALGAVFCFGVGFGVGQNWSSGREIREVIAWSQSPEASVGLLSPQAFLPQIPTKEMTFDFPTKFEDTGPEGDKLWKDMMPLGAGFIRVPYPRRFDMPQSKSIPDDPEEGEIYSLSITHQLHCLAVLRHVIIKYEKHDKSRYAGDGHEYHCIDYIRQAIMCAGDTTLDYAELVIGTDGVGRRLGFMGTNSTHKCRDWDAIREWAVENRSGDKVGIL